MSLATNEQIALSSPQPSATVLPILLAVSFCHLLNDTVQSLIPAIYPLIKTAFSLNFTQIGLITLTFQMTASILQPMVGLYTDRRPRPYALPCGMTLTLIGLALLSRAGSFHGVLCAAALVGIGSSIFHPEASRAAHLAAGRRHGFAQSLLQVGGNAGSSLGPLLAALIVVPHGQANILWFALAPLLGIVILTRVGSWSRGHLDRKKPSPIMSAGRQTLSQQRIVLSIAILLALVFSKHFYLASIASYYTFYLIDKFHLTVQAAQIHLFIFLLAVAAGTIIGGPVGDRIGRKQVIWVSILGVAPFSLMLPHANLFWTGVLSVAVGLILASAFSTILVYAQELLPARVGMIAGLFFGFAFGIAGIGSAVLGKLADHTSINYVFQLCAFLPLIGIVTGFLPDLETRPGKVTN